MVWNSHQLVETYLCSIKNNLSGWMLSAGGGGPIRAKQLLCWWLTHWKNGINQPGFYPRLRVIQSSPIFWLFLQADGAAKFVTTCSTDIIYIYTHIILRTAAEPKACAFRRAARLPWGRSSGIRPNLIPDQTGTQHESWAGLLWGLTQTSPQRLWCSSKKFRKKKGSKERSTDGCHQHWSSCFDHRHMLKLCEWPAGKAPSWLCQIKHQLASVFPTFWQYPQLYPQFYGGRH